MNSAFILGTKRIPRKDKSGKLTGDFNILLSTDQGDAWIPEAVFLNATGTLDHKQFVNGSVSFDWMKIGEALTDGRTVTSENSLINYLTLSIELDPSFAAKKAANIEMIQLDKIAQELRIQQAKKRAKYAQETPAEENGDEGDENAPEAQGNPAAVAAGEEAPEGENPF